MKKIFIWADPNQIDTSAPVNVQFEQSGFNFGNLVISHGAMCLFPRELLSYPKDFKHPEEIAESCSHVICPVANILWPGFDMKSTFDYLSKIPLPLIMLGVGTQTNNRNITQSINEVTLKLMRLVSERSASIGVRGYYTAEVLAHHGIHNTSILGCPSFYMNLEPSKIKPLQGDSFNSISVNFSRRVGSHSFNPFKLQKIENALLKMALNHNADFIAQDELDEINLSRGDDRGFSDISKYFNESSSNEVKNFFTRKTRFFAKPHDWLEYFSSKNVSIGSRFHGNIISLLSGIPALFFVHDSRTMELSSLINAPSIHIDEIDDALIKPEYIKEKIYSANFESFEKAHKELFSRMRKFLEINNLHSSLLLNRSN
jgi:hypothetical protein